MSPDPSIPSTPATQPDSATGGAARRAPVLSSGQRRHLRSLAHPLKPIVFVGEAGISPAVLAALEEALATHELVKVRLRQPADKKEAARELAERTGAALCGVVGHTVVLYRPDPETPRIPLPASD